MDALHVASDKRSPVHLAEISTLPLFQQDHRRVVVSASSVSSQDQSVLKRDLGAYANLSPYTASPTFVLPSVLAAQARKQCIFEEDG